MEVLNKDLRGIILEYVIDNFENIPDETFRKIFSDPQRYKTIFMRTFYKALGRKKTIGEKITFVLYKNRFLNNLMNDCKEESCRGDGRVYYGPIKCCSSWCDTIVGIGMSCSCGHVN
jgi:hypothetical protein